MEYLKHEDLEKEFIKVIEKVTGSEFLEVKENTIDIYSVNGKEQATTTADYYFKPFDKKVAYMTKCYLKNILPDDCYVKQCIKAGTDTEVIIIKIKPYFMFEIIGNIIRKGV
jgi:hypothetical protein